MSPTVPVNFWASQALFSFRFVVLALPMSGVVLVFNSNVCIGVKVVLDFLFFFVWGGGVGGRGCGLASHQNMSRFERLAT